MMLLTESEEVIRLLPERHVLSDRITRKHRKMAIRTAYEVVMPYHLHMPSYFLGTFTEYPYLSFKIEKRCKVFCSIKIRLLAK